MCTRQREIPAGWSSTHGERGSAFGLLGSRKDIICIVILLLIIGTDLEGTLKPKTRSYASYRAASGSCACGMRAQKNNRRAHLPHREAAARAPGGQGQVRAHVAAHLPSSAPYSAPCAVRDALSSRLRNGAYAMIICLSGFVIAGGRPLSQHPRASCRAESAPPPPPPPQPPAHAEPEWGSARYAALHHRLLHHYPALPPPPRGAALGTPALELAHTCPCTTCTAYIAGGVSSVRSDTSSTDSGSSASPPPHPPPPAHPPRALPHQSTGVPPPPAPPYLRHPRYTRVRTLYACLGESEGELSFEPNQIITNVSASAEPGWLTGTLNGATGLVPENYVEPLP
ncbi:Rho GTPase-activating protein 26 [Eumeta japonica]|uniref:Rho GTPase-activating protein 26 n=1 Tax=Eumeta variegata TaxID=151549 RepID=A0A4C1ZIU9_EUMVA|nr:Rho GTPase-activating protein 26 [Eumeta japonica]